MENSQINNVCELVRKAEDIYVYGTTTISKYVEVSMYETLSRIDAYINSKHTTGDTDADGRDKPFFNIVIAAVNIWYRATDIDRKNIKIKSTKSTQDIAAFLATVHLQRWMRKENFGKFLNKWGRVLAKYGSAVSKFVKQDGSLNALVIPWARMIVDTIDFYANPQIEILQLTPAQLRKKKEYNQDMVEALITASSVSRTTVNGQKVDNKDNYIKVYEVHGELSLEDYKKAKGYEISEGDATTYEQQMHVVSFVAKTDKPEEYDDYTLYCGKEAKSPYLKDDLIEEDDQTLAIGAVQNLFDSQWMVNHSAKNVKDVLDFISTMIYQTSDGNLVGQNVLSSLTIGDVLVHAPNSPLTQISNNVDVSAHINFQNQWRSLGNQINGISEAMMGMNQPSGSAWRQTEALLNESHSLFEVMTENKGLAIETMLREFIIPHLKTLMDSTEEISVTLDSYHINKIDSMFVPNEAIKRGNQQMINQALSEQVASQADYNAHTKQVQTELSQQGNQRYFKPSDIDTKTWNDLFTDLEWELEVDITGEQRDTQLVMQTLNTALKYVTTATPQQLADPNFKLVFNKILEESAVISPIEIASIPQPPPVQSANKVSESLSYKDAPDDIKRQIEQQAGLQPSNVGATQQTNTNQSKKIKAVVSNK